MASNLLNSHVARTIAGGAWSDANADHTVKQGEYRNALKQRSG